MRNALMQAAVLGRRAVIRTARQPANVVFPLIFPMLLFAVNSGGLKAETRLPGFPTNSFVAFGVRLQTGIAGAVMLLVLEAVIALAFASFGSWAALRTGSTEAVQGLFPVFFVFLFLSSMNIPRNLISTTWFRWVATANPVSYLIEAVRSLVIQHWRWETIGLGFAVSIGLSIVGFALATHALWRRLERT